MMKRMCGQSGLTLFEAVLALLLGGLVIGGIWVAGASAINNHKINQLERGITETIVHIRDFYKDRPMVAGELNNTTLISSNLVSQEFDVGASGSITHKLSTSGNGPVILSLPGNCVGGNDYSIQLVNLTRAACGKIVAALAGTHSQAEATGIGRVIVNGTNVMGTGTTAQYDLNQSTLASQCADDVNVEFCFKQF